MYPAQISHTDNLVYKANQLLPCPCVFVGTVGTLVGTTWDSVGTVGTGVQDFNMEVLLYSPYGPYKIPIVPTPSLQCPYTTGGS